MGVEQGGRKKEGATLHIFQELKRRDDTQEQLGAKGSCFSLGQELWGTALSFHCSSSLGKTLDLAILGDSLMGEQVAVKH